MKFITPTKLLAVAFLATTLCPLAALRAQEVAYELAPSALTLALVIKKTAPGTSVRNEVGGAFITENRQRIPAFSNEWITGSTFNYEFVTRISATSYGNKELLNDLIAAAVIPGPIQGWSVLLKYEPVKGTYTDGNGDSQEYIYYEPALAVRKGTQIIEVPEEKARFEITPLASASAANSSGRMSSTQSTASGKYTSESAVSMTVTAPTLGSVVLNGFMSDSTSSFYWYPIAADRLVQDSISVPKSTKITGLVGAEDVEPNPDSDSDPGPGVITGAITVGASNAVKK
jgi:hypothetical protein